MSAPASKLSRKEAVALLWNKGVLHWKLDSTQKQLYDSYVQSTSRTLVWAASRRLGKSYALCTIAVETCLRKQNAIVKYTAPTQKAVKLIIRPLIKEILKDCPKELRPDFMTGENLYRFPNGSEIQLAGTDSGNAENLRGGQADLCLVDEAGFCDDLEYIVKSILIPTMTTTGGKIILASTPPVSPDHAFIRVFKEKAEATGSYIKKTIYDNPRLTQAQIQSIMDEVGGARSTQFRREYLCEVIKEADSAVVPEWTDEAKALYVKEWEHPPFFDPYVAMDLGKKDLTVVLFAYFDFLADKVIVEDEFVLNGAKLNTTHLANGIKDKEAKLWTNPLTLEKKEPYLRVSDNNLIVIGDLWSLHGLEFVPTKKDDAEAALNAMRIMIENGRIIIHPRCTTLIRHLSNAIWNKQRTSYARSADDGHYDAIDALKYLVRSIQYTRNPYPKGYNVHFGDTRMRNPFHKPAQPSAFESFKDIFKPKRSFRSS